MLEALFVMWPARTWADAARNLTLTAPGNSTAAQFVSELAAVLSVPSGDVSARSAVMKSPAASPRPRH